MVKSAHDSIDTNFYITHLSLLAVYAKARVEEGIVSILTYNVGIDNHGTVSSNHSFEYYTGLAK